jgi:hypothetical protein
VNPADLELEGYDNDGIRELLMNAYMDEVLEDNKYELLDVVDKKNVAIYGRSWTRLNIVDGFPKIAIHDAFDVLIDRYALPWDIDSARRITLVGLYRSLFDLELNPLYDKAAIAKLRTFFATKQGLVIAAQNSQIVADRAKRLEDMGVPDVQYPLLSETYVELNEQQRKVWHPDEGQDVIHVIVTANASIFDRHAVREEIAGERISEPVRDHHVRTLRDFGVREYLAKRSLPARHRGEWLPVS